jgi:hypothetical protein
MRAALLANAQRTEAQHNGGGPELRYRERAEPLGGDDHSMPHKGADLSEALVETSGTRTRAAVFLAKARKTWNLRPSN